jgi:cytochrome P450
MYYSLILYSLLGLVAARCIYFIVWSLLSPLRSVPGPFWTRFTRLWYFNRLNQGHFEDDNIALHRKYGPIVRIAPDMYSIDSPEIVKIAYSIGSNWRKSDWYEGWKHPSPARFTVFADRDNKRHGDSRKQFNAVYSMSSMKSYEGYVDDCTEIFSTRLGEFAQNGQSFNMGHWFQCYAFDVIGAITYSQRFGFLDAGEDVGGLIEALHGMMRYSSLVGIYPGWHPRIFDFAAKFKSVGSGGRLYIQNFVAKRENERKAQGDVEKWQDKDESAPQDFLEKMLIAHKRNPQKTTAYHVTMMGMSNIIAGSDTTALSLSGVLYYLLKYPRTLERLRDEIRTFEQQGRCSRPNVTFAESQEMPYLQACLKEGMRLHAATGLPLWREVPEGGAEICGKFFPAGTVIGLNSWVAHYNTDVFGPDAQHFRPERWIEAEKAGGEHLKSMDNYYLPVSFLTVPWFSSD